MQQMRADELMVKQGLTHTRSQASNLIKLKKVTASGDVIKKAGQMVPLDATIQLTKTETYVSRAGFKLESAAKLLDLTFKDSTVLDVGSSTGGFTDFVLQQGAKKVIAVDVGANQLHPSLRTNPKIELHEKTDIRDFIINPDVIEVVVIDVSFISLRTILPAVARLTNKKTRIIAMVKPQFESGDSLKHKGVIKNDTMRRKILKDFEQWATDSFIIIDKADSEVAGSKGNRERFYLLQKAR